MNKFNKERLREIAKPNQSNWIERAKWRKNNQYWLSKSRAIALKIAITLKEKNISQREFAEELNVSPQQVNKLLKGEENLTLETISRIEAKLNIKLIELSEAQINVEA